MFAVLVICLNGGNQKSPLRNFINVHIKTNESTCVMTGYNHNGGGSMPNYVLARVDAESMCSNESM